MIFVPLKQTSPLGLESVLKYYISGTSFNFKSHIETGAPTDPGLLSEGV